MKKVLQLLFVFVLIFSYSLRIIEAERGTMVVDLNENETLTFLIMNGKLMTETDKYYTQNAKKMASLRTESFIQYWGDNHFCAGVLISRRMVLTAAHCIMDKYRIPLKEARLRIIAGSPERLRPSRSSIELEVNKIVAHPRYKRYSRNDIAVLLMKEDIPLTDTVKFSSLAKKTPKIREKCITFGWGQLYPNGPYADELFYMDVEIVPAKNCRRVYEDYDDIMNLCAVDVERLGDVCPGDTGGPLFCESRLSGIVAGNDLCTGKRPMKFTNVAYFEDWIIRTQFSKATLFPSSMFSFSISTVALVING